MFDGHPWIAECTKHPQTESLDVRLSPFLEPRYEIDVVIFGTGGSGDQGEP